MKEAISINIGQAGVQVSNAAWELFCIEHGIRSDGNRIDALDDVDERCEIFFQPLTSTYLPRVVSVDFEPTVIDEIRLGPYRNLFHPDQLISGFEDCANNFARGSFTVGKLHLKTVMRQITRLVENCDCLQGFCLLNSFDGGTGSGFSSSLEEALSLNYGKKSKFQLGIYPSRKMATSTVYPYNSIFHTHATMNHTDLSVLMDNEAIYNICVNKLNIMKPSYSNINRIIAQLFSSITVSMRFKNFLNSDIDQICTNLIPYPRIHFPLSHLSPLLSMDVVDKETCNVGEITRDIFDQDNQLVQCDTMNGRFMACVMQFRGRIAPNEVNKAIYEIKRRTDIQFVDWCPTGFKVGINNKPLASPPGSEMAQIQKSLSMLSNTSAIVETWSDLLQKFNSLFSQRAFVHWFVGEGLEEAEFGEAFDDIKSLEQDYLEVSSPSDGVPAGGARAGSNTQSKRSRSRESKGSRSQSIEMPPKAISKKSTKESRKGGHTSRTPSLDFANSTNDPNGPLSAIRNNTKEPSRDGSIDSKEDAFGPMAASRLNTKESRQGSLEFKDTVFDEFGPPQALRKNTSEKSQKGSSDDKGGSGNIIKQASNEGVVMSMKKISSELKGRQNDAGSVTKQASKESEAKSMKKESTESKGGPNVDNDGGNISKQASKESNALSVKEEFKESKGGKNENIGEGNISTQASRESTIKTLKKGSNDSKVGQNEENGAGVISKNISKVNSLELSKHLSNEGKSSVNDENGPASANRRSTVELKKKGSSEFKDNVNDEFGPAESKRKSTMDSSKQGSVDFKDGINDEFGPAIASRRSTVELSKEISLNIIVDDNGPGGNVKKDSKDSSNAGLSVGKGYSYSKDGDNDKNGPPSAIRVNTFDSSAKDSSIFKDSVNDEFGPPIAIRKSTVDSGKEVSSDFKDNINDDKGPPMAIRRSTKDSNDTNQSYRKGSKNSEQPPIIVARQSTKESPNQTLSVRKVSSGSKRDKEEGDPPTFLVLDNVVLSARLSKQGSLDTKLGHSKEIVNSKNTYASTITSNVYQTASTDINDRHIFDHKSVSTAIESLGESNAAKELSNKMSKDSKGSPTKDVVPD